MVAPNVISSSVLGLVAWWLGSHSNLVMVRDLVARNFKGDDIFAAWSKLREVIQLAEGQAVHPPIRHKAEIRVRPKPKSSGLNQEPTRNKVPGFGSWYPNCSYSWYCFRFLV